MCFREGEMGETLHVPATHKVGEEIPHDEPMLIRKIGSIPVSMSARHNLTQYVCCRHFRAILGPAVTCETARTQGAH
jgi:hypothetical protein